MIKANIQRLVEMVNRLERLKEESAKESRLELFIELDEIKSKLEVIRDKEIEREKK